MGIHEALYLLSLSCAIGLGVYALYTMMRNLRSGYKLELMRAIHFDLIGITKIGNSSIHFDDLYDCYVLTIHDDSLMGSLGLPSSVHDLTWDSKPHINRMKIVRDIESHGGYRYVGADRGNEFKIVVMEHKLKQLQRRIVREKSNADNKRKMDDTQPLR